MIALPPVVRMLILAAALLAAAIVLWVVVSIRTDRPSNARQFTAARI